ncbi:ATP-binding cassette domain-containing protein [Tropicimonas sp. TH_r6]|uniref:oligopeptide/dipeptide ABC transporter ATP-binding protein n=1 Tax=Tropicimonas sp. TH_r6 TaxID=3082085 RepID=UPI002955279C|nr:oligopeptide/dipeptide ABC transporter ATP-binding protein [Tropicimonas sp. TH_r6]MDV7142294.1 ATP-binding cassette domain-containing protein [Tropicimonas sp. TH_r6]
MSTPLLKVEDLQVTFNIRPRGAWPWTPSIPLHAVGGVSFELEKGETLGIVGESGSGKSTVARAIINTVPASGGRVLWKGDDLLQMDPTKRREHRQAAQMVFQDPLAALNPRMKVGEIIAEPLITHAPQTPKAEVKRRVGELMERVGLLPNLINRYPHEFSGGQCQRIGIARALILNPELVICDEPVSALDVSVQAQVINLLSELQRDLGLSLIFIAHDLSVVKHISDNILVMYLGRVMETADADTLIDAPVHPYTRSLVQAVPIPDPKVELAREHPVLEGDLPSPLSPPSGCVFRTRCPLANASCAGERPGPEQIAPGHVSYCPVTAGERLAQNA